MIFYDVWGFLCLNLFPFSTSFSLSMSLSPHRLMALRLDPSTLPPTPRCQVAREANRLEGAAAEAPKHTSSSLNPNPSSSLSPSLTLPCISTELSRLTNSLLTPLYCSILSSLFPSLCLFLSLSFSHVFPKSLDHTYGSRGCVLIINLTSYSLMRIESASPADIPTKF